MDWHNLPPLTALRAFAALAETGSASAAGARLNVSHAAISQQVKALEAHLGLTLVTRAGRGLALSAEGAELAEALAEGFGGMAAAVARLTGVEAARPVQVSTTPQFASHWLMPRLGAFQARHPEVDLMIHPSPQRADPSPGGVDVALRFGGGTWPGLDAELLVPTNIVVAASPSLVGDREFQHPEDMLEYPWLDELEASQADDWLHAHGVTQKRCKSVTMVPGNLMVDGLRAGQGIAVLSGISIADDVAAGRLRVLFEDKGETGYFIVTRPGVQRPQAKMLIRWLRTLKVTGVELRTTAPANGLRQ